MLTCELWVYSMDIQNKNVHLSDNDLLPTRKQLERDIAHKFNAINYQMLGCRSEKMTCTIFDSYLAIVGESAMTPVEQAIYSKGQTDIILAIRESINRTLQQQLEQIVKELVRVEPLDSCCKLSLNTGRLIAFVILSEIPTFRLKRSRRKDKALLSEK